MKGLLFLGGLAFCLWGFGLKAQGPLKDPLDNCVVQRQWVLGENASLRRQLAELREQVLQRDSGELVCEILGKQKLSCEDFELRVGSDGIPLIVERNGVKK